MVRFHRGDQVKLLGKVVDPVGYIGYVWLLLVRADHGTEWNGRWRGETEERENGTINER